jgi:hypothetical protein
MQIYAVFGSDFDANAQATGILSKYGVSGKVGVIHQKEYTGSIVRATARPESDPDDSRQWAWVEAAVWTDRMLAALGNGVRGG